LDSRSEYLILPLGGDPYLIVPMQNQLFNAKANSWIKEVWAGEDMGGMVFAVAKAIKMSKLENEAIGVVGLKNAIPFSDYQLLTRELPNARFKDATELLDKIRMIKSPEEIDMIHQTADIADRCYETVLDVLRVGKDEMEVMAEVYKVLGGRGVEDILILTAKGPYFPGFINHPGPYTFKEGDSYVFSIEIAGPSGYWTQIVRPLCLGKTTSRHERMFKAAKAALEEGISYLVPGKRIGELVRAVVGKVEKEGFRTGIWCGHGMGLDVGESPGLFPDSDVQLKEGMCITIHPHVMSIDGKEGIFLGDTFVVEKNGPKKLSQSVCNLECL
jgi:Xaa-Pro aminopeptidase